MTVSGLKYKIGKHKPHDQGAEIAFLLFLLYSRPVLGRMGKAGNRTG